MGEVFIEESFQRAFQDETSGHLERMAEIFLILEENPEIQSEVIHELFRLAHNIKGASGMMELTALKELMHRLENRFDEVRSGKAELTPERVDQMIRIVQQVQQYVADSGQWDRDDELKEAQNRLEWNPGSTSTELNTNVQAELVFEDFENQEISAWQEAGKAVYGVDLNYPEDCSLPGAAALVFINYVEQYGSVFKTVPEREKMITGLFTILRVVLFANTELTKEQLDEITAYNGHGETGIRIRKWATRRIAPAKPVSTSKPDEVIRVDYQKIELLMAELDELFTLKTQLAEVFEKEKSAVINRNEITNAFFHIDQTIRTLQGNVMNLSMIPVKQLFARFPMVVRDIAHQSGKEVELVFRGEETEIDKRVAEQLAAPLTHIIRNAVDHGIEPVEERRAAGKSPKGTIELSAKQEGEMIVFRIADDGRGLNTAKIRRKALEKALIQETDVLTEEELVQLIFKPGFSTADQVTDISGRGVGMDVVQNNIHALNGTIRITTQPDQGTTFSLKIPLSQAIISAFFIRTGGRIFGFTMNEVVEGLRIDPGQVALRDELLTLSYQKEFIPVFELNEWFGGGAHFWNEDYPCLVLKGKDRYLGIWADELLGQQKVLVRPLNGALIDNPLVAGATILSNGEEALMINTGPVDVWYQSQIRMEVVS